MFRVVLLLLSWVSIAFADSMDPGSGVGHSVGAGSPFSDYGMGIAIYSFLTGVLVTGLLLGAFLVLNLGLMSKREEDRVGKRNPSDVGILKEAVWPEEPYERTVLPAEEFPEVPAQVETIGTVKGLPREDHSPERGAA